jgi:hypothetical protein
MSRCAHQQYSFLRKLPSCPKCKAQLITVFARYENGHEAWEWECTKCTRVFPLSSFNEEKDDWELYLNQKFGKVDYNNIQREKTRKRSKKKWDMSYKNQN